MFQLKRDDSGRSIGLVACDKLDYGISQDGSSMFIVTRSECKYSIEIPFNEIDGVVAGLQWCKNAIEQAKLRAEYDEDENNYVSLGDVCRGKLGMQYYYGSRYADPAWHPEWKYCGMGLRITGTSDAYYAMKIHQDDVAEFVRRVQEARNSCTFEDGVGGDGD